MISIPCFDACLATNDRILNPLCCERRSFSHFVGGFLLFVWDLLCVSKNQITLNKYRECFRRDRVFIQFL